MSGASGPAALFIDHFGGGGGIGGGGFHGGGFGGGSFGGGGFRGGDFAGGDFRGGFHGDDVHIGDTNINRVRGHLLACSHLPRGLVPGRSRCGGRSGWGGDWRAAARPYYYNSYYNNQQCGYYPYPPCY